jgi:membrane protein DedA with SNARE-associated domain
MPSGSILLLIWLLAALFLGTMIHEDAAILSGAYLAADGSLPAMLALPVLFCGVVAGDFAIYGLGALARRTADRGRNGWLRRRIDGDTVARVERWLRHNAFLIVAACRVLPLALFPTYAACGWLRVSFRRFAAPVLISAALYVPIMFTLFQLFGEGLSRRLDKWGWIVAAAVLVLALLLRRKFSPTKLLNRLAPAGVPADALAGEAWLPPKPAARAEPCEPAIATHPGMPPLRLAQIRVPLSERIAEPVFYAPLVAQWLWLGLRHRCLTLPTVANPLIETGGLLGESKFSYFAQAGAGARPWLARTALLERPEDGVGAAEAAMRRAALAFPIVVKPDIAWRGFGCRLVAERRALADYLAAFPAGARLLLQEYVPHHGEAGVFYARRPGAEIGHIFSMTFRYYPFVIGDGRSTLAELIRRDRRLARKAALHLAAHRARLGEIPAAGEIVRLALVGSNRVGGLYVDASRHATAALAGRIEAIAAAIPEFHFGRFDLRFASVERLEAGEDFTIVEVNGAGAEAIHVWDPEFRLADAYRVLFRQQSLMFAIAAANRARGWRPMRARDLVACQRRQRRLNAAYPPSG